MTTMREALEALLSYVDRNTCTHEETHRGGVIWTICNDCGAKWADDQGGFKPHKDAPEVAAARAALSNHSEYTPITVSHKTRPEWRPDPKTVEVAAEIAAVWRISKLNNGDLTDSQLNDFLNEIGPNIAATIRSLLSHPSAVS